MKIILTQSDFQQALAAHINQFGIDVDPSQISVDVGEIEIELNPVDSLEPGAPEKQTTETKRRTRRSSAEVAAERAAKEAEDAAKASDALDQDIASTRTTEIPENTEEEEEDPDLEGDSLMDIVDAISETKTVTEPPVGGSIFD